MVTAWLDLEAVSAIGKALASPPAAGPGSVDRLDCRAPRFQAINQAAGGRLSLYVVVLAAVCHMPVIEPS
jgi:hypothetical protein